jgi:DNA recombination protein RmuC
MPTGVTVAALLVAALALAAVIVLARGGVRGTTGPVLQRLDGVQREQERQGRFLRDEASRARLEAAQQSRDLREEVATSVQGMNRALVESVARLSSAQQRELDLVVQRLGASSDATEQRLTELRRSLDAGLQRLQQENSAKLDEMRQTVDERLQGTLEQRLGESFRQVSERLEAVHRGLGEMQILAAGVGDLKRVLTNVKTRGTWGEVQLGSLLDQLLTPEQYEANVAVRPGSGERVEFAVRLPGRNDADRPVWLPIDAKFPTEDYQRLLDAHEQGDAAGEEAAARRLEARIRAAAKDIRDKYVHPPGTTDFALMFLPTEGLYAEVLRRPGLAERLQCDSRVVPVGPTTLAAVLNSLQMGFRSLAIEQRSSEVWQLLGAVKAQFSQFGEVLDKVQVKLHQASDTIEQAAKRTRTIERRLREVEELPTEQADLLLPSPLCADPAEGTDPR